jgi:hypothetical protein
MATSSSDPDAPTELVTLPDPEDLELDEEGDEIAEVPTQPIALFELPPEKRKHLPPRGDVKTVSERPIAQNESVPDRIPLVEREDFGENTFAGALAAVKSVIEQADAESAAPAKPKGRKSSK